MSSVNFSKQSDDSAAESFRLSLNKLGKLKLSITPVNYALIYFYISGNDLALNSKLDVLFENSEQWNDDEAFKLFNQYICQNDDLTRTDNEQRKDLLGTVANILGMLIDLAGKTAISNEALEVHMENLAACKDPGEILRIASKMIAETRKFVDETRQFESELSDSTIQIQSLKNKLDDARKQATKDALTGLNNRRGFDETILSTIKFKDEYSEPFCLLLIDIDHFKEINDSHGHLVGDRVLVGLSKVLSKHVRGSDFLCRYGGEEFATIMTDTLITGAFTVAENLRKSVEKLRLKDIKTGQQIGQVTISIGVASFRFGESGNGLIGRCDKALYRAKSLGRNRTVIAD